MYIFYNKGVINMREKIYFFYELLGGEYMILKFVDVFYICVGKYFEFVLIFFDDLIEIV